MKGLCDLPSTPVVRKEVKDKAKRGDEASLRSVVGALVELFRKVPAVEACIDAREVVKHVCGLHDDGHAIQTTIKSNELRKAQLAILALTAIISAAAAYLWTNRK